jgi:outer membrane protein OmpA-like peptidoglycan-associated protein
MKKVMICLFGCCLLALVSARAQDASHDTSANPIPDTSFRYRGDTTTPVQVRDTVITVADAPKTPADDKAKADKPAKDTTSDDQQEETTRQLDRRWFISPLLKAQFQDFAMLEKNRKGYLSDANTLSFFQRGNASLAASAYKNITQRLSISADIGLSFGHVTNNDVLISQTKSQTFNLINAAIYYHLISPSYRLQPYVTVGFNDIINNGSYPALPMGLGAKFNGRKVMVLGQVTYGYGLSKSIASTTMYSVGIYIPIKNKKSKQLDKDDNSPYNRALKDQAKKKDSTSKNNGNITINNYITINMDSVLKAKGLLDANGNPFNGTARNGNDDGSNGGGNSNGSNGKKHGSRYRNGGNGGGSGADGDDDDGDDAASRTRRRKKPFTALGLDDFSDNDYRIDSLDGRPTIHFVVYFEFNEYGLNSKAFNSIDKVISALRRSPDFTVEIKGYTDSVGSDPYNNMLSRRRAKMVLDYMNSRGVPTELMKAKAYGSDNPVADNSDPNQAWLNRRAEIIVHRKELAAQ